MNVTRSRSTTSLPAGDERIEPRPRLVDRELVELALDADDRDAAAPRQLSADSFHASVRPLAA